MADIKGNDIKGGIALQKIYLSFSSYPFRSM